MSFALNGVIIPEDVANSLYINGTNTTDLFINGVQVWNQSLFNGTWSNSTLTTGDIQGIQASGSNFRWVHDNGTNPLAYSTTWLSVSSLGTFTNGRSSVFDAEYYIGVVSGGYGTTTASNKIAMLFQWASTSGEISFSRTGGFTGISQIADGSSRFVLNTSGGAIRYQNYARYGTWAYIN